MIAIGKLIYFIKDVHAKIRIIAFKNNDESDWISDPQEIKSKFEPSGEVFEPGFKHNHGYEIKSYLLFIPEKNPHSEGGDHDKYKIKSIRSDLTYQVSSSDHLFQNQLFIDLDYLNSISDDLSERFYIYYQNKYFGVFKKSTHGVIPAIGRTIQVFKNLDTVRDGEIEIVTRKPKPSKNKVYAETEKQIEDWFYGLIKDIDHPVFQFLSQHRDWHNIFLEHLEVDGEVNQLRLEMAVNMLDQIDLTYQQIQSIGEHSFAFEKAIDNKIDEYRQEIDNELRPELEKLILRENSILNEKRKEIAQIEGLIKERKKDLEKVSENLEKIKSDFTDEKLRIQSKIQKILTEVTDIENRRKELVTTLKLSAEINNSDKTQNYIKPIRFSYLGEEEHPDFPSFLKSISSVIESFGIQGYQSSHIDDLLLSLSNYKCIIGESLEFILGILRAFNKCHINYVNVEMNWLSYTFIEDLKIYEMFKEAANDPTSLFVLILRDINLSSPECYLRPILDFNNELIPAPMGDMLHWPENFKLIGIIQKTPEIGMPILESTFKGWKGLLPFEPTFAAKNTLTENRYMSFPSFRRYFAEYPYEGNNHLHEYTSPL